MVSLERVDSQEAVRAGGPLDHADEGGPGQRGGGGSLTESATVPICKLLPAIDAPRLDGENVDHINTLAISDAVLPPVLVHRQSLRVIDGSHRLRAAMLRGDDTIEVVYFDGSNEEAFVAAVEANTTHGLPLSLVDRKAAAARILRGYPTWSDRAIAKITGLAAKTVAAIRRPTEDLQQLDTRVGKDGRVRPVNGTAGRLRAADVIKAKPDSSLREIARAAGVSPMTARDVRDRLKRDHAPTNKERSRHEPAASVRPRRAVEGKPEPVADPVIIIKNLCRDPSLRQTETGRALLRRLDLQARTLTEYPMAAEHLPPHCMYALVELAHSFAVRWRSLAGELEQHLEEVMTR